MRGTLFLVVGPSGAGKDTLIAAARERLAHAYAFPRRTITRPAIPGDEDHIVEDTATFEAHERAGAFALSWRAHGVAYGIPATIAGDLDAGRHVIANVSRATVPEARRRFQPCRVILVTASADVLRARLTARRREDASAIAERLERAPPVEADTIIVNDGPLEEGVVALVNALKG